MYRGNIIKNTSRYINAIRVLKMKQFTHYIQNKKNCYHNVCYKKIILFLINN